MDRRDALKALLALPVVQTVEVARLKPEDTIVISSPSSLCRDMSRRIEDYASRAFPGQRVIVLSEGLTLKVVRQ